VRRRFRRALTLGALVAATLLATAAPALAHVTLAPATAAPGQFTTYTVTVPNERDDQATVEVDLTLPTGFVLEVAQQVPGWQTVTVKAADGLPTGVRWTGGRIPVGTYGTFGVEGRNPRSGSSMRWQAVQRYEHITVRWDGSATSETPAPIVRLAVTAGQSAAAGASTAAAGVDAGNPNAAGQDPVARSRANLGLVAGLTALLIVLGAAGRRVLQRRGEPAAPPVSPADPDPMPAKPAPRSPSRAASDSSARGPAKASGPAKAKRDG
jgi:uncharacterized protein YcnI